MAKRLLLFGLDVDHYLKGKKKIPQKKIDATLCMNKRYKKAKIFKGCK